MAKSDPEAQELVRIRLKGLRPYLSGLDNASIAKCLNIS